MESQAGDALLDAIITKDPVSGYTHNFYRYPARFSPLFVREVIRQYSRPHHVVLDPFMGGGTAIIEALAMGRAAVGVDLNSLAHFVTTVKTTPLSIHDILLREWLKDLQTTRRRGVSEIIQPVRNLPRPVQGVWADLMEQADWLPLERQRHFVRCALLKTGQWAIDCKNSIPSARETFNQFAENLTEMMQGVEDFVQSCGRHGITKGEIRRNRLLFCRSATGRVLALGRT